jgi:hypothetical protein
VGVVLVGGGVMRVLGGRRVEDGGVVAAWEALEGEGEGVLPPAWRRTLSTSSGLPRMMETAPEM